MKSMCASAHVSWLLWGLGRDHPEVSEALCVEMMTRQLASAGTSGLKHQVLSCLVPWMQNLSLTPRWKGAQLAFPCPSASESSLGPGPSLTFLIA